MSDDIAAHELGSQSRKELGEYISRIETLTEEKKAVAEKIKSEFADAASSGYDKKAIQQILKDRAADSEKTVQGRAVTNVYRRAIASLSGTPLGDWARGWLAQEARINKPTTSERSAELDALMKGRKTKNDGENPAPPLAS